jgi:hypothetical protein
MKLSAGRIGATAGIAVAIGALVIGGIAFADHGSSRPTGGPAVLVDDHPTPGASHSDGPDDSDHHGVGPSASPGRDDHGEDATEGTDDHGTGVDTDEHHRGATPCPSAATCQHGVDD